MIQFEKTTKISSKGQITLPKPVRDLLGSDWVRVVIDGDTVHLEPVPQVAGGLGQYARRYIPTAEAVGQAWSGVRDPGMEKRMNRVEAPSKARNWPLIGFDKALNKLKRCS
jgi:AbrB family looped-hinge helix DNA binding protein